MARAKKTRSRDFLKGRKEGGKSRCAGCGEAIDVDGFEWVSLYCAGNNYLSHYGCSYSSNCADSVMAEQRQNSSNESKEGSVPKFEDL
jgi:hypothetical protein